jgi:uncharacterized small protein (DUF1192 family)
LSIVSTAHLSDAERLFVTALLLDKVKTWMRRQGGTTTLRAAVYMDEIFGYLPPHPQSPPTKKPLLTLLKQARAQGVGVVLATQNPVDLDYKGLANIGTWMVGTLQTAQDRERLRDGLVGSGVDAAGLDQMFDALRKRVFLLHDVHRPRPCLMHSRWAMAYLRGPLTRDEIERLMAARKSAPTSAPGAVASAAARPASTAAAPAAVPSTPLLPAPFRNLYLKRYGGDLADAHLLVKYAVRYKTAGEIIGLRAYPLGVATAAELLESEPSTVDDESAVAAEAPAGARYGDLPPWLAAAGAKGIEKTLKDRLADKLAVTVLYDPVTKATSQPGEEREAFAQRIQAAGGGAAAEKLRDKLEKKKRDLVLREQDVSGRKQEKWMALGSALLGGIGLLTGKRRTISGALSGAGSALSKNRMEDTAEARLEALRAEIAGLEAELADVAGVDPARFEEKTEVPARTAVKILRYELVWVY